MSELDRLQNAFRKADALAQQGDERAREDARAFAAEIRRLSSQPQQRERGRGMAQLNTGIAETVGGAIDFLNPFDQPHSLNPFPEGTGSAVTGIRNVMEAGGIRTTDEDPQSVGEAMMRGAGEAAGGLPFVAAGLAQLARAGGGVGRFAQDALRVLGTAPGVAGEVGAGALFEGGAKTAEQAGAPEWVQTTAGLGAAVAAPVAGAMALRAPGVTLARKGFETARAAVAPFTRSGATEVARTRMQDLAGGAERAEELASRVGGENPLGLTPAQQTGDPNMMALEQVAAADSPTLRDLLQSRRVAGQETARREIVGTGDPQAARQFFEDRRQQFRAELGQRAERAMLESERDIRGIDASRDPGDNSLVVSDRLRQAYDQARAQENQLWQDVPLDSLTVDISEARAVAQNLARELGRAKADDLPAKARQLLLEDGGYGDQESARELHNLYSEMREVARNARAGTNQRRGLARAADMIADGILEDMAGVPALGEARAYSAALHDTFDQGAVGRLLKLTNDGDTAIAPELALERTVGRGGTQAMVSSRQIEEADVFPTRFTPSQGELSPVIQDYVRGQFARRAVGDTGEITTAKARTFMRDNAELFKRYPELRGELDQAVLSRENAEQFAQRIERRVAAVSDARRSATERFIGGQAEEAVRAVFAAGNPARTARRLANEARKDPSGEALAGLKAAFADVIVGQATTTKAGQQILGADSLIAALEKPANRSALGVIFNEGELSRMRFIARELAKMEASTRAAPDIGGSLSGAQANQAVEFALRVLAVKNAPGPGGVRDLQTSQMLSSRVRDYWRSLSADRASQMIADSITDPELFKALLTQRGKAELDRRALPYILPYLIGGGTAALTE